MKLDNINNINFGKIHVANCNVIKNDTPLPCKIYKLEESDCDYYCKMKKQDIWQNACFGYCYGLIPPERFIEADIFAMEDENQKCFGVCEVSSNLSSKGIYLEAIETAPKYSNKNKQRKIKYIGETLISFLVDYYRKMQKTFHVKSALGEAEDFYSKNCHMSIEKEIIFKDYFLPEENVQQLLLQNEKHTKSKIELFGDF